MVNHLIDRDNQASAFRCDTLQAVFVAAEQNTCNRGAMPFDKRIIALGAPQGIGELKVRAMKTWVAKIHHTIQNRDAHFRNSCRLLPKLSKTWKIFNAGNAQRKLP